LLLLIWVAVGIALRFTNLALKPASSIEIATIGYSLGHGFNAIPLDRLVSIDILLAPLHLDTAIGYGEVFNRLVEESTHPPLYFWLTYWWANLWINDGNLVSLQVARSLSALFGIMTIPAVFALGWVAFRSRLVAHFAAILMAISPYGIYLAQEARHYTLTVLWVIASLVCLCQTISLLQRKVAIPLWLGLIWIVINALGIATHYFFVLALGAEAIALIIFWLFNPTEQPLKYLQKLYLIGIGTLASGLAWLPIISSISDNEMTTWIQTSYELNEILLPLPRLLAWMITMVMLLPVEGVSKLVSITSGIVVLAVLIWVMPILIKQWRLPFGYPKGLALHRASRSQFVNAASYQTRSAMTLIAGYVFSSLMINLLVIYGMGQDISLAARYHFVYFPGLILLVAVALAPCWRQDLISGNKLIGHNLSAAGNRVVIVLLAMGLVGSFTVITNLGFQKSLASDRLAAHIQEFSILPAVVAMTHKTHSEIRELVALALSFERLNVDKAQIPQFILVQQDQTGADLATSNFAQILKAQTKPLNLFGINLDLDDEKLKQLGCIRHEAIDLSKSGYRDRFYLCQPE
jgi:uncharacterized membrane protein